MRAHSTFPVALGQGGEDSNNSYRPRLATYQGKLEASFKAEQIERNKDNLVNATHFTLIQSLLSAIYLDLKIYAKLLFLAQFLTTLA